MVRVQRQFRYIKDGDARNYPTSLTRDQLISGAFLDQSTRITHLEINALVGFGFYLNNTPTMVRIMHPGDPSTNEVESRRIVIPDSVLAMNPVYNIKIDAASLDRLIRWNNSSAGNGNEIWLFIDYISEESN